MDEEWATLMLDMEDAGEEPITRTTEDEETISPLGYTDEISRLDLIADRIMSVRTALFAVNSDDGSEQQFPPMKRPVTAAERLREQRTRSLITGIEAEIFGAGFSVSELQILD
jgi:hypothetical protein